MNNQIMLSGREKRADRQRHGQSLVEFALILPLFVLLIVGVFDLGRAFFAYIAISNAAREGARVVTFWPEKTEINDVNIAVENEIGNDSLVDVDNIASIVIECVDPDTTNFFVVSTDEELSDCATENSVIVTVTYTQTLILSFFFPEPLMLKRSAEMMVP
jgi:Flp pilus assembly protein TadG